MSLQLRIAWIDADLQRTQLALRLLARPGEGWLLRHIAHPEREDCGPGGWSAVVLCLAPGAQALPDWALAPAPWPLLLCLAPGQQALAAQALRRDARGPAGGDYLVSSDQDGLAEWDFPRLHACLAALLRPPAAPPRQREQLAQLHTALASMSQGILQTDARGRVTVYNQRALELLNFSEALMASRPTLAQLTQLQLQRGDFGGDCTLVDGRGREYIQGGAREFSPELYQRQTNCGRTLEVRTKTLPDGGLVRTFADISDYVQVHGELRRSEARFRSLCALSSDWYWEQDAQLRFADITGVAAQRNTLLQTWLGRTLEEIGAANMGEAHWLLLRERMARREAFRELELQQRAGDGEPMWIALSGEPIVDADGALQGYRGVGRDISRRKRTESEIERLAFYDPLTGLPNRRLLRDRLARLCSALERSRRHAALLFIDLDNFKDLNDTRGHERGDELLVLVAQRLCECLRAGDTVARLGGDEFVVLSEGLAFTAEQARGDAEEVARKVAQALSQPYVLSDGQGCHTTPSIGLTVFAHPVPATEELLRQADFAMYQAKAAGRNAIRLFDPGLLEQMRARSQLEAELRHALSLGDLRLHHQPVVNVAGGVIGAEALVRWQHHERGLVAPGEFIPLAEQTGLILPLGRWVLQRACEQLAAWAGQPGLDELVLSVNVSARQFRQAEFTDQVRAALRASGARAHLLRLELTESLLLTDTEEMIAKMVELRAEGVGFSLDDFGTGYSSLSYLKRLPLDQLKIDRAFVRDVLTDPNDAAIVRTILALARSLDLRVVAEGVETDEQLHFLRQHGCPAFQGYLFGRPVPVHEFERACRPAA